jgi:hypothetical protein
MKLPRGCRLRGRVQRKVSSAGSSKGIASRRRSGDPRLSRSSRARSTRVVHLRPAFVSDASRDTYDSAASSSSRLARTLDSIRRAPAAVALKGAQPDGPRRSQPPGALPRTRPRQQVRGSVRCRLRERRRPHHPHAGPSAERERARRALGRQRPPRVSRPAPDRRPPPRRTHPPRLTSAITTAGGRTARSTSSGPTHSASRWPEATRRRR